MGTVPASPTCAWSRVNTQEMLLSFVVYKMDIIVATTLLMCARCYPKDVTDMNSYSPYSNPSGRYCRYLHFTGEKTEAQVDHTVSEWQSGRFERAVWLLSARLEPFFLTWGYFPP